MPIRHPLLQAVALIAAALVFAIVANGFASRTRKLMLPGYYPGALRVPPHEKATPSTPVQATATIETTSATTSATTTTVAPLTTSIAPATTITAPLTTTTTTTVATTTIARTTPTPPTATAPPATTTTAPKPSAPPASKSSPATPTADALSKYAPHPSNAYVEIGGDEAALLHDKGVLFLDARRSSVFADGHIPGARSYSVWESDIDEKVNALFNERSDPREQNLPIVVYCSGGACEDSHMLAEKLWGIQFNNVYVYKDGFPDWQKRGLPVHTGAQP